MRLKSLAPLLTAALLSVALACAGTASAAIPAGNTGWTWANPLPQGNTMDRVEASGGRIWAGGATGTLLHSDDNGVSWAAVRTGLLDDIRTIEAISPTSVVFAGRCALRRSDDGGATVKRLAWGSSDDSCAAQIQAISFPSPLLGYLLLTNGDVYATGDAGDSWKKQGVAPGSTASGGSSAVRDISFTSPSIGVLSVGNRVMQTVDAGVSWTPVATYGGGPGLLNFEFVSSTIGYAVGAGTDTLKTTDGGTTWNVVPAGPSKGYYNATGISCVSETVCLASLENGGVLRTLDGGANWDGVITSSVPVYAVTFVNDTMAVAVGTGGVTLRSVDGGVTWFPINSVAEGKFRGLRVDSPTSALIFGDQGQIARSMNGGSSWSSLTAAGTVGIVDAASAGANRIYALNGAGTLQLSENAGSTWKNVKTGAPGKSRAIFAWKPSRLLIVGPKGVRVSTARGAKSKPVAGKVSKLALNSVDGAGSVLFAYGRKSIVVTADKGLTWSIVKRPRGVGTIKQLDMLDAKYGFLLDSNAELFATRNGGRLWSRVETTGANVAVGMSFGDRKHGYLTDNTGRVLETSDGGATWSRQYPFYDATSTSLSLVAATGKLSALTLVTNTNRVFSTTTAGRIGSTSKLTITPSASKVRKGTVVRVTGTLSPALGTERVAVLARVVNAKGGTRWVSQERTVSATGTFTTSWRIAESTEFIARWSGDAARDGDAAPLAVVKLRR